MAKIRSLALRDIPKLKKMISMISNLSSADVAFGYKSYVPFPLNAINRILPLSLKFASDILRAGESASFFLMKTAMMSGVSLSALLLQNTVQWVPTLLW